MNRFDYGPAEDCSEVFRDADETFSAWESAKERLDAASNPITRLYFSAVTSLRRGAAFDSHEHAEMIAEVNALVAKPPTPSE